MATHKHIALIVGHPDAQGKHFAHALAEAYADGARAAGHEVKSIDVATLDFPLLRSQADFEKGQPPETIRQAQATLRWADHLVLFFPLWLGTMPALLKGFLEQVFRPGFAFRATSSGLPQKLLAGKSARIVVTMGMPGFVYRWYFRAHGVKNLKRNILGFCGMRPVRDTIIGMVESSDARRKRWLRKIRALGEAAE
ncbi:MAG: NAD(P)H-dependent oxidoreductase [Sulfurifustaceae bacterium]